jgi:hypothetical protein
MGHPEPKNIGDVTVSVDYNGWPRWTRLNIRNGERGAFIFNEEQARDLHYALTRVVEFLDDMKHLDRKRGIEAGG